MDQINRIKVSNINTVSSLGKKNNRCVSYVWADVLTYAQKDILKVICQIIWPMCIRSSVFFLSPVWASKIWICKISIYKILMPKKKKKCIRLFNYSRYSCYPLQGYILSLFQKPHTIMVCTRFWNSTFNFTISSFLSFQCVSNQIHVILSRTFMCMYQTYTLFLPADKVLINSIMIMGSNYAGFITPFLLVNE